MIEMTMQEKILKLQEENQTRDALYASINNDDYFARKVAEQKECDRNDILQSQKTA